MNSINNQFKSKDMLEIIYTAEECEIDKRIKQVKNNLNNKIKEINIEEIINNAQHQSKDELKKVFETMEENYSIKAAAYIKEAFKQGFIDGVNLMLNCYDSHLQ